ncbi:hypothetical protein [Streptomyces sp. NPDC001970]
MSEYPYDDFPPIDRPLTSDKLDVVCAVSSRARIPPTSVVNEYDFGDCRGDERRPMEHVSDAHLYPLVRLRPACGPCRPLVTGASSGSSPHVR